MSRDERAELAISVLVATRNRAPLLARTLDDLANQALGDLAWEVVVVDNGSDDDTGRVLAEAAGRLPLVTLREDRPGKNFALNRGLDVARGELLVFTDDDVVLPADWLRELSAATRRWPEDNIFGGSIDPVFPPGTPRWLSSPDFPHTRWAFSGYRPRDSEGPTSETPLGPNMAVRRRAMPADGFDVTIGPTGGPSYAMGSEVELLLRLHREGEQFIFVPGATVGHVVRPDEVARSNLRRRATRCGRGNARLYPGRSRFPVLGVPAYQVRRLVHSLLRYTSTRFSGQEKRWIAGMELAQAWGNVREHHAMTRRSRGTADPRPWLPRPAVAWNALRKIGTVGLLRAGMETLVSPFIRRTVVEIYETPISSEAGAPAPLAGISIESFDSPEHARAARIALAPLSAIGMERIDAHLERGCVLVVAFDDRGRAVGYAFSSYSDIPITELGRTLRVPADAVVGFDGFVVPEWRGRGLLGVLDAHQMAIASAAGRDRQLIYARADNRASIRSLARMGKRHHFRVVRTDYPLLGRTRLESTDPEAEGELLPIDSSRTSDSVE